MVDGAEQVAAGRVALEEVLEVAGDEVIDHKHHSHRLAVLSCSNSKRLCLRI